MDENIIKSGILQKLWMRLCELFVRSFYKRVEIHQAEQLEQNQPIILCANHSNALADAVLLQYCSPKLIHPIARSGLFKNSLIKPILTIWQAIPVYRRQDTTSDEVDNQAMFNKVYEMLHQNQVLMIFPEGQSHSDTRLRDIKSGISRIILGYREIYGVAPVVIPVGLNFSQTFRLRSNVFINFGNVINIDSQLSIYNELDVKQLTQTIQQAMKKQVLEADAVEDLGFAQQVERFFALRHKKFKKRNLRQKFNSQKMLLNVKDYLSEHVPERVDSFKRHLRQFNRLCMKLGINDYNLNISYNSKVIRQFILRTLLTVFFLLPLGVLGLVHSLIPYLLTRFATPVFIQGRDQRDTAKILLGSFLFPLFWGLQSWYVFNNYSTTVTTIYILSIIPTSLIALVIFYEQVRILDNLRVFFVLVKQKHLRRYLLRKRKQIEAELASLLKLAKKYRQLD